MISSSRRAFLAGSAALPAMAGGLGEDAPNTVAATLARYIGFGLKPAGGPGDTACGEWLASELAGSGYSIERQSFSVPFFEASRSELSCDGATASLWAQPVVVPTGPGGATGPLVRLDAAGNAAGPLSGAIALIDLPFARWSSALAKPMREPVAGAFTAGAKGVVAITNGPTGKVIALNADGRKPMFDGPVALLAPEKARPFLAATIHNRPATMTITGESGRRDAFNFVGRIDRGKARWLVVSTPRSGWFTCAGERGPGIAIWLWLAQWASREVHDHNLAFVCNTGHEYEYLGAAEALKSFVPRPSATALWLHLGANVAARDWHESAGQWQPLPSVDTQRYLSVSRALLPLAQEVFAGHAGLEAAYSTDVLNAGELTEIVAAGYMRVAGVFGVHRFHHVADDDARCVSAASVTHAATAFQRFIERVLQRSDNRPVA